MKKRTYQPVVLCISALLLSSPKISQAQASKEQYHNPPSNCLSDIVPAFKSFPKDVLNLMARYLSAADISCRLWATGFEEKAVLEQQLNDHTVAACFSPDGKTIISPKADQVQSWNAHDGKRLGAMVHLTHRKPIYIQSASYNNSGDQIVLTCNNVAIVYEIKTKKNSTLTGHTAQVWNAKFHPLETQQIVTASADTTARVWHCALLPPVIRTLKHTHIVSDASFNHDGTKIITTSHDHQARVWDASTGALFLTVLKEQLINKAIFNPTNDTLILSNWLNQIIICDGQTGTLLHTLKGHKDTLSSIVCSSDGNIIISSSQDNTVRVWDAKTGGCLHESVWKNAFSNRQFSCRVSSINLSADNTKLVAVGSDLEARVFAPACSTHSITMDQVIAIKLLDQYWQLDKNSQTKSQTIAMIAQKEQLESTALEQAINSFKDPQMRTTLARIYALA